MFYTKNVSGWERVARFLMGAVGLGFAIANWGTSSASVAVGSMAAMLALTGLVGFCPMCAMFGRKLHVKED